MRERIRHEWAKLSRFWAGARYRLQGITPAGAFRGRRFVERLRGQTEHNIWYLYVEIFWAGILTAIASFNATYALRLGATNTMIGWLSSIPSLLAIVMLIPSARFLETKNDRGPYVRGSLFLARLMYLGVALAPWIARDRAAALIVAVLLLSAVPANFFSAGWGPMFVDVVPMRDRAVVMSTRSVVHGLTVAVCTFAFGKWLDAAGSPSAGSGLAWARLPMNYQVLYIIGAIAGLVSVYFVAKIRIPETPVPARKESKKARPKLRETFDGVRVMARENRGFFRIMTNTFIFNCGAWLVGPLYIIFFVKQLGASDGWVGLNTTFAYAGLIVGNLVWRRVMDRRGMRWTLLLTILPAASYAFLVAVMPNLTLILVFGVLISFINAGVDLSHANTFYATCPIDRRASYMALYGTVANIGAFVAPMAGVALSAVLDIRWILVIGGVIRLFGASMFHWYRIPVVEGEAT
ncbi:MAG: MFS transporter [Anaerolineae bacterium]|jgi:MFS family permease|nr:MFS transporter [Anaerolineae bacterium]